MTKVFQSSPTKILSTNSANIIEQNKENIIESDSESREVVKKGYLLNNINLSTIPGIIQNAIDAAVALKEQKEKELSVPSSITARQARLALFKIGKLDHVSIAINSLESPIKEQIQIEWEYATEIYRNHNFIETLGDSLGLDKNALDELFVSGKSFV